MDMFSITDMVDKDLSYLDSLNIKLINTPELFEEARKRLLEGPKVLGLDLETTGLSFMHHDIVGVVLGVDDVEGFYFPIKHKIGKNIDQTEMIMLLRELVKTKRFTFANAKFDYKFVYKKYNIDPEIEGDVLVEAYVVDCNLAESGNLNLKELTSREFNIKPMELSDIGEYNFALYDPEEAYLYAAPDGTYTQKHHFNYTKKINEMGMERVAKLENIILKPIAEMEMAGVLVDTEFLKSLTSDMEQFMSSIKKEIFIQAGTEFDISSPKQLATILYDDIGLKPMNKNGTEIKSTGADVLNFLTKQHPLPKLILDYREVNKLYTDFVLKLPEIAAEDSRLHSQFKSTGTRSGRFSSSGGFGKNGVEIKANLQQIPNDIKFDLIKEYEIPDNPNIDPTKLYTIEELKTLGINL